MKNLLFLLFPFLLQAQSALPDTIIVKNNKVYPCLITEITKSKVYFDYPGWEKSELVIEAVDAIVLADKGKVYTSAKGYDENFEDIQQFVKEREEKRSYEEKQIKQQEEKAKIAEASYIPHPVEKELNTSIVTAEERTMQPVEKRWSFGVLLIPYYSGRIYSYVRNSDGAAGNVITSVNNEINMEGQFAYKLNKNVSLTFDVGYTSAYTDNKYDSHNRANGASSSYDYGYDMSNDLKLISLNIGAKYYLTNYEEDFVNAYFLAGIGKQFAIAESENKELYPQGTQDYVFEDNQDDYIEDMNSPWNFNLGFGAEYMFNKSLSVYSVIRFYYSKIDAEYKSREMNPNQTNTVNREYTQSDFITRIGVGLNFYF